MDVVSSSLTAISLLLTPLEACCFYSSKFEERVRKLHSEMEALNTKQNDLKVEISSGKVNQRKKIRSEIQLWLKDVENIVVEVKHIETEIDRCMKGCLCFPNYLSRYRLGKMMVTKINDMIELHAKGAFSNGLFIESFPETGRILPTAGLVGDKTFNRVSKAIWKVLTDANTCKIGVHGMGGVGKTSIMMHIYNQLIECKIFDRVIWVNVSKTFNLEKLQLDIANATNLELLEDENVIWRSTRLLEHLQGKKFVLILDDMWEKFSLEEVGIPQPNIDNGCKFVFITRVMEVCRGMETQKEIKVELLSKNEAWDLFTSKSGPIDNYEIVPVAKAVCENCGGLPLAIITVARAMRRIENKRLWENALEELESSRADIVGMEEDVFSRLKFSYLHLKDEHLQACFLYCALFPEDHNIHDAELIEYWMAENLISEVGDREKEINKGYTVLEKLKDACLLEEIEPNYIKMHDLIRDMAIRIARTGPRLINKSAMKLNRLAKEWIENVEWVSVMDNNIAILPNNPNCQKLSTFLLQRNPLSEKVPDSFFVQMQSLKVLDLSKTEIKSLPESVSALSNLRALLLSFCKLKELPSLARLKEPRVLDLSHSLLRKLPPDIENLVNLRRLDLSYTEKLKAFPFGVIQKLSCLENFSIFRSKWRWSSSRGVTEGVGFAEISRWVGLTNLGLSFEDRESFVDYVRSSHWRDLHSYHLGIGLLSIFLPIFKGTRSIEIQGYDLVSQENVIELPDNIQQLALHSCHDLTFLSKLFEKTNLESLRQCYLSNCNGMEFITSSNRFPNLELLVLRKLPKLKAISNRIVASSQIFTSLKSLQIHGCNSMKYLFSSGMPLQDFQKLEEIEIWNSSLIEQMVEDETGGNVSGFSSVVLPKLRRLSFSALPELKFITKRVMVCDSLETIDIWDCEKLKTLPFSINSLPFSLKHIKGNRIWWDGLEWDESNCKNLLQPFFDQGT